MTTLQEQCIELLPVIQAGAEGKKIECFNGKKWVHKTEPGFLVTLSYRVAKTHEVNGFTVPAAETTAPKHKTEYWTPYLANYDWVNDYIWDDDVVDKRLLVRGLVFLQKEHAVANAKAMCGIDPAAEE